jgi:cell wall-associated NlpC family hydrolase
MPLFKYPIVLRAILLILCGLIIAGCSSRRHPAYQYRYQTKTPPKKELTRMGYTIQAGAFAQAQNAVRLTDRLCKRGLDATYFVAATGLYKVRFGNFSSREAARKRAEALKQSGVIAEYYIVAPEDYAVAKRQQLGDSYLRDELAKTAQSFLGVPYLWGGTSAETGFDCSGLTMTVYQLNGLNLPRSSRDQFEAGTPIDRDELQKGDLLFFATSTPGKVTHVGVYLGGGEFIHAPGRGKTICKDSLSKSFFQKHYIGARTYL